MSLRSRAAQVLLRVLKDGQSLTAALDAVVAEPQAKAFIQALCYGVVRHYYRLDFLLARLLDKPLKSKDLDIKVLLLIGLYQLRYMRVKPHAAVSETVAAAKHKAWAKSLINAVLRCYQRDADRLERQADADRAASLNHPQWLLEQIQMQWPEQAALICAENDRPPPMTLRVNVRHGTAEIYRQTLQQYDLAADLVDFCQTAVVLHSPMPVEQLPGFVDGRVSVQDTAAQLAVELLELAAGQRVLDMCAAPGGKTAAILERQADLQTLVAVDIDADRLQRVAGNLQRLALQAQLLTADAGEPTFAGDQRFDRILLDAPCSGLGVIRRHPDIKLLRRPEDIGVLQTLQRRMLESAWQLLVPGGVLLYATCSILQQENERQIAGFVADHDDAEHIAIDAEWGLVRSFGRQILSGDRQMDGFYYAKLRKAG